MAEVSHLSLSHPRSDLRKAAREMTPNSENESDVGNSSKRFKPNFDLEEERRTWEELLLDAETVLSTSSFGSSSCASVNQKLNSLLNCKSSYQSKLSNVLLQKIDEACASMQPQIEAVYGMEGSNAKLSKYIDLYEGWVNNLRLLSNAFVGLNTYLHRHPIKKTIFDHGVNEFIVSYWVKDLDRILPEALAVLSQLRLEAVSTKKSLLYTEQTVTLMMFFRMSSVNDNFYKMSIGKAIQERMLEDYSEDSKLRECIMKQYPQEYLPTVHDVCHWESSFMRECEFDKQFRFRTIVKLEWLLVLENFDTVISDILEYVYRSNQQKELLFSLCIEAQDQFAINYMNNLLKAIENLVKRKVTDFLNSTDPKDFYRIITGLYEFDEIKQWVVPGGFGSPSGFKGAFGLLLSLKKYNALIISLLCKYIDTQLRSPQDEVSLVSSKVIFVVTGLFNKLDFCENYKRDLSRRLLQSRSLNLSGEKILFHSLELHVGKDEDVIRSISTMFTDMASVEEQYSKLDGFDIDFKPMVLENNQWPTVPKQSLILPPEFASILQKYETDVFLPMATKNKSKTLDWTAYSVHQLTIVATFASGTKDLIINMLQAVVLFAFLDKDERTLKELRAETGMGELLLRNIVSSFDKYKILVFSEDGNSARFNYNLRDKRSKIRIPLARETVSAASAPIIREPVIGDRKDEFRATIVRHMKEVKAGKYEDLLHEVVENAERKGPFRLTDIKRCIEELIKDGYIERLDGESLRYVP